jgi:predicted transcriptional regulator
MEQLTPQEEQLMLYVWDAGKGFIKDFRDRYPGTTKPPYTTVATIMKKLEAKGYVQATLYGNTHEYRPRVKRDKYRNRHLSDIVSNYFQNSYKEMVCQFAREEKLSEQDLEEIIRLIKKPE